MGSGIYIATSGAIAQDAALDVTANNIANATTTGYKSERTSFGEALANTRSVDAAFAGVTGTTTDNSAGTLQQSGNPLDVAVVGDGLFGVNTPDGPRYTRAGDFRLDTGGRLVTAEGYAVRGTRGAEVRIPEGATNVSIERDGTVIVDEAEISKLELSRFDPASLRRDGNNLFAATEPAAAGPPVEIRSGAIEQSNVNVIRGVVDLVKISRTYETLMKMIQGYRDIDNSAARGLGRGK